MDAAGDRVLQLRDRRGLPANPGLADLGDQPPNHPQQARVSRRSRVWEVRRRLHLSEIETHRETIKGWLGTVTVSTIHQRLRDDHGLGVSESSLRRFIWANLAEEAARASVVVLRDTPPPGDEAQVDYGLLGRWPDPVTGRVRRVWGFIIVLRYSRLLFLRPVLSMDLGSWVEAHVLAMEFFGGAPARVVPDYVPRNISLSSVPDRVMWPWTAGGR
jgi:hypothetical protein